MVKDFNKVPFYRKVVMAETYTVNECCCCLGSLKCGTLIIGIIYTVTYLIN
jgi:hypothetical protein